MYRCEALNDIKQIENVYKILMKKDFPKNELKPFSIIKKEISRNEYICYGIYDDSDVLCGYAFLVMRTNNDGRKNYLLDYFAVTEAERNKGIGSVFLELLINQLFDADIIICEAENPTYAVNDEDRNLRQRRVNFYLRNNFADTGVSAELFGVEYMILEVNKNSEHSQEEIKHFYKDAYSKIIPDFILRKNFLIH